METKIWSGGSKEEYETQLFGFGTQRLKIAMREMIEERLTTAVTDMTQFMEEKLKLNDSEKADLSLWSKKLVQKFSEDARPSFEVIDKEIDNMLRIPPNVVLPEDEENVVNTSNTEYEKLKEEVDALKKRVERAALMEALLTEEQEELQALETVCEAAVKDMEITDIMVKNADTHETLKSFQNNTQFLLASVPGMNKVLDIFDS